MTTYEINREFKQSFDCSKCNRTTKITDYTWEDRNLYYKLSKLKICEECARNG